MLDAEFVDRPFLQAGNEQFPDAAGNVFAHRMAAAVPGVEIADQADAAGVRRPDGEIHPRDAVDRPQLGAQPAVAIPMPPFAQQMQIVAGQQRREGVGIVPGRLLAALDRWFAACRSLRRELSVKGQIASYKPAGWIRRIGVEQAWAGSTTQAFVVPGKNARTARARRPASTTSCGPRISNGFSFRPSTSAVICSALILSDSRVAGMLCGSVVGSVLA